jgi:hypothetical protein
MFGQSAEVLLETTGIVSAWHALQCKVVLQILLTNKYQLSDSMKMFFVLYVFQGLLKDHDYALIVEDASRPRQ